MSKQNSTISPQQEKPQCPDHSPFFWHPRGGWCKKVRGRLHYFGRIDHDEALAEYTRVKADLEAGRTPRDGSDAFTVYKLCARFLEAKKDQREHGELSPRSFIAYADVCKLLIKQMGKNRLVADLHPDDFAKLRSRMGRTWGPVRLKSEIVRTRTPFHWAYKQGLLEKPMVYGEGFNLPTKKTIRKHKAAQDAKMFEAHEIRAMLDGAGQPLRSMLLLGINGGFSNGDIGALPLKALDLQGGWLTFAREKTGIMRKIPLWAETVASLKEWLAQRPEPKDVAHAGIVFVTARGASWSSGGTNRALSHEVKKLLDKLGINGHRNYYCLRHGLQTIGDETGDFIAVRSIMGHATSDIADVYRERISDDRLKKVTEHVRAWLFAVEESKAGQVEYTGRRSN